MDRHQVDHFKRKMRHLTKVAKLKERVRYERAIDGTLAHRFPEGYAEAAVAALDELLEEDHETSGRRLERLLDIIRKHASTPFL